MSKNWTYPTIHHFCDPLTWAKPFGKFVMPAKDNRIACGTSNEDTVVFCPGSFPVIVFDKHTSKYRSVEIEDLVFEEGAAPKTDFSSILHMAIACGESDRNIVFFTTNGDENIIYRWDLRDDRVKVEYKAKPSQVITGLITFPETPNTMVCYLCGKEYGKSMECGLTGVGHPVEVKGLSILDKIWGFYCPTNRSGSHDFYLLVGGARPNYKVDLFSGIKTELHPDDGSVQPGDPLNAVLKCYRDGDYVSLDAATHCSHVYWTANGDAVYLDNGYNFMLKPSGKAAITLCSPRYVQGASESFTMLDDHTALLKTGPNGLGGEPVYSLFDFSTGARCDFEG